MILSNIISKTFGKIANTKFPKFIQKFINFSYTKLMSVDLSEFQNIDEFNSLNELFTRSLIKPREFDLSENSIISPVDSFVTEMGKLNEEKLLQIKGMEYSVEKLLTKDITYLSRVLNGNYANFYLSPKDYHRYHIPCDLEIKKVIHIAGKLYPVNFRYLRKKLNLFIENERVVIEALTKDKKVIYLVLVGALNVGKMILSFEPKIKTNTEADKVKIYNYENLFLKKGESFGYFEMGSTIVAIFEKDLIELEDIKNRNVKFGDLIAKFK